MESISGDIIVFRSFALIYWITLIQYSVHGINAGNIFGHNKTYTCRKFKQKLSSYDTTTIYEKMSSEVLIQSPQVYSERNTLCLYLPSSKEQDSTLQVSY